MKYKIIHYTKTFHPNVPEGAKVLRRIFNKAHHYPDGSALSMYMPLSDKDDNGKRHRCPEGENIYTPVGWNMLAGAYKLFFPENTLHSHLPPVREN